MLLDPWLISVGPAGPFVRFFMCPDCGDLVHDSYVKRLREEGKLEFDCPCGAGIHIGPIHVEEGDVFGGTVNFTARVAGAIQVAEIWLSDWAKQDIDSVGAAKHKELKFERHEAITMKGFPGKFNLWAVAK